MKETKPTKKKKKQNETEEHTNPRLRKNGQQKSKINRNIKDWKKLAVIGE